MRDAEWERNFFQPLPDCSQVSVHRLQGSKTWFVIGVLLAHVTKSAGIKLNDEQNPLGNAGLFALLNIDFSVFF